MSSYRLSVCMAGMSHRRKPFLESIRKKAPDWVEFVFDDRDGISIGAKRNSMIQKCSGEYIAVIDDDDDITDSYFDEMLKGISLGVHAICIRIARYIDGDLRYIRTFGAENPYREDGDPVIPAGHFCAIRADIVKEVGYRDLGKGEDLDHQARLIEHLKTAYYVPLVTYIQYYTSRKKEYDFDQNFTTLQVSGKPQV